MSGDIAVKPVRKTLKQTATILNISVKSVRRLADKGELTWSKGQITVASIEKWQKDAEGKRAREESEEEINKQVEEVMNEKEKPKPRTSRGNGKPWAQRW